MSRPTIYIFINASLQMTAGKLGAQAAHAAVMSTIESGEQRQIEWENAVHKTIILLEARDESHLRNILEYLKERNIRSKRIIDEGVNEIDPHTWTAVATTIVDKDDPDTVAALSTFKVYKPTIRFNVELDR